MLSGSRQSPAPTQRFTISVASCPAASLPSRGTAVPYCAVTDHVPSSVSSRLRSLQRGQSCPSSRTSRRQSSTRYAVVGNTTPSTFTCVTFATGYGRATSEIDEHEQPDEHVPHAMLNHFPPTSAGAGYGHDIPPTSYHPVDGIHGHAGKQSFRHGRSVIEQRPNCFFVPSHSTSVAIHSASSICSAE